MIRRRLATILIVVFFAYAAYLITTDGGKSMATVESLTENIKNRLGFGNTPSSS